MHIVTLDDHLAWSWACLESAAWEAHLFRAVHFACVAVFLSCNLNMLINLQAMLGACESR